MKVLFVSVEVAPYAKVGGLADVAGSLPRELQTQGHDVRIVMPLYRMIDEDPAWQLETVVVDLPVRVGPKLVKLATVKTGLQHGVRVWFIGTDEWFTESISSATVYVPGCMQHLFFSTAVLRVAEHLGWMPDVVHANDWHTGFLPVIMRESNPGWDAVASVFTIHNLAYQGEFGTEVLDVLGLPRALYTPELLETWGRVNFLKAGCVYADRVNTVSERYAEEIQTPEFGCSLHGLMAHLAEEGCLSGILNGIDLDRFDPRHDPEIPARFGPGDRRGKETCRALLLEELDMEPIDGAPVVGVVSRLSGQKGMDLMIDAAEAMFALPMQLVVLGIGEPWIAEGFRALQARFPDHLRFVERFDVGLAQRIYAGCDGFLMPSSFEPCGLGQLIALRYGTVPVVREAGGLADTVREGQNGFTFRDRTTTAMLAALIRMHRAYLDPFEWSRLVEAGLNGEYGWSESARRYGRLYEEAVASRARVPAARPA